ncbi:hypothetical protein Mth01_54520 [Sphaerimonospora thailandensis]|uniref:Uncharacterized protein n=1 Tax=Sphaerimonospora thailandensis TaxID=795644 RepID=A0A8J3RE76_9ACTN|nr:hypothetical protein Mth01_54520 [Sphaerimonospora thailandensis]
MILLCKICGGISAAISAALSGSREYGEAGGIQVITWTRGCVISNLPRQYGPRDCGPYHERVVRKEYAPL